MTAPTTDQTDAPIPDDLLLQVLSGKTEGSPLGDLGASDDAPDPAPATDAVDPPSDATEDSAEVDPTDETAAPVDPVAPVDPFAALMQDAAPLTYKVNGSERPFDAILMTGDGKPAIIPADKVGQVRDMVARYESNAAANRELYQTVQRYESLGGLEKFHELQERNAQLNAASLHILDSLVAMGLPQETLALLQREAKIAAAEARFTTIEQRQTAEQTFATTTNDAAVKESAIPSAIDTHFAHVPASDRDAAKAYFAQFRDALMFKATPEQALQWNVKPGTWMVDLPKMAPYFETLANARTTAATEAEKRAAAAKHNATVTAPKVAPKPTPKAKAQPRREDGTFAEKPSKPTREDFMMAALGGKPTPGTTYDDD